MKVDASKILEEAIQEIAQKSYEIWSLKAQIKELTQELKTKKENDTDEI